MSLFCFMIKHFLKHSHQSQQAFEMLTGELRCNKKHSNLANLLGERVVYHHACRLLHYKRIGNHF